MQLHELTCFGAEAGDGNHALVIESGPADAAARQALAKARNTTCVFLDRGVDGGRILDYYYPHARSPLCLHATLAAAYVLLPVVPALSDTLTVHTAMRAQPLLLSRDADDFYVQLEAHPVPQPPPPDLRALLGLDAALAPPRAASVGSPKLLVEVATSATLHALHPDLAAIAAWSHAHAINGIYAWCRHPDGTFEGRNFNHLDPALEDRATGVAAGALTALLGHGLTLLQGHGCLLRTRFAGEAILVGGRAGPA
jgi:PhzF family phenazine biosynthesis protein